jgi:DNA-binding NarL/FixJ family response regulator
MVDILGGMTTRTPEDEELFRRLKEVRAEAIRHTVIARGYATQRREILTRLISNGHSQAEIARELGVTRQAIQKMIAVG